MSDDDLRGFVQRGLADGVGRSLRASSLGALIKSVTVPLSVTCIAALMVGGDFDPNPKLAQAAAVAGLSFLVQFMSSGGRSANGACLRHVAVFE